MPRLDVVSEQVGTVIGIHVTNGQRVEKDDALISVETMKCETVYTAPSDGIVWLHICDGEFVQDSELIAEVEVE